MSIGAGHWLAPAAAGSWKTMRRPAGGQYALPTDSYRDLAGQKACVADKGLYSSGGLCAEPGTSKHGCGVAVDVPEPMRTWMRSNGRRYGWSANVPGEPWHFEYVGAAGAN